MSQFQREYSDITDLWDSIELLASPLTTTRSKRAVLPFMSEILGVLFGTASESDLQVLKDTVSSIAKSQDHVTHVLSQSLTLINKTHEAMKQNRGVINQLSVATDTLSMGFAKLYDELVHNVSPRVDMLELSSRIHSIFHPVSSTMRQTHIEIQSLCTQITESIRGVMSIELITPQMLMPVIERIHKQLPKGISLPYPINKENLIKYYKYLSVMFLPDTNKFHIITALPLVHEAFTFNMFKAISVPVPSDKLSLVAEYVLESEYIAVSKDDHRYILQNYAESADCVGNDFCKVNSPMLMVRNNHMDCIMALYLRDSLLVTQNCKCNLKQIGDAPIIKYLFNGK